MVYVDRRSGNGLRLAARSPAICVGPIQGDADIAASRPDERDRRYAKEQTHGEECEDDSLHNPTPYYTDSNSGNEAFPGCTSRTKPGETVGSRQSNRSVGQASSARSDHCIGKLRAAHSLNTRVGSRASAGYTPALGVALSAMSAVPIAAPTAPRYEAGGVGRLRVAS